ncbi:hypothetical protein ACFV23_01945 [Streptomyces sp. NPDC059627]
MSIALPQTLLHREPVLRLLGRCSAVTEALCARKPPTSTAVLVLVITEVDWLVMAGCAPQVAVATVATSGIVAAELRQRLS